MTKKARTLVLYQPKKSPNSELGNLIKNPGRTTAKTKTAEKKEIERVRLNKSAVAERCGRGKSRAREKSRTKAARPALRRWERNRLRVAAVQQETVPFLIPRKDRIGAKAERTVAPLRASYDARDPVRRGKKLFPGWARGSDPKKERNGIQRGKTFHLRHEKSRKRAGQEVKGEPFVGPWSGSAEGKEKTHWQR